MFQTLRKLFTPKPHVFAGKLMKANERALHIRESDIAIMKGFMRHYLRLRKDPMETHHPWERLGSRDHTLAAFVRSVLTEEELADIEERIKNED